jgi:hypothetical protein
LIRPGLSGGSIRPRVDHPASRRTFRQLDFEGWRGVAFPRSSRLAGGSATPMAGGCDLMRRPLPRPNASTRQVPAARRSYGVRALVLS